MNNAIATVPANLPALITQEKAQSLIELMEKQGRAEIREIYPQANKYLEEQGPGAWMLAKALGDVQENALESTTFEGKFSDTVNLQMIAPNADGHRFVFFAGNGGLKAKIKGLVKDEFLLIMYRGDVESATKGFKPFHDYAVMIFRSERDAHEFLSQLSAA